METWTQGERNLARKLFVEHNRRNGALYPDGFGFLRPDDMRVWLEKARNELTGLDLAAFDD